MTSNGNRTIPHGETSEARIAKALAHPLRARILQRLGERVASPGDLADELGAPLGVVSYHVRMLRDYDCVELVRTEPRRGALQHFYKAIERPELGEQWRELPSSLREELAGETVTALVSDLSAAALAGTLMEDEVVLSRVLLELDERGIKKVNKLVLKTLEQILAIAQESQDRLGEVGGERTLTEVGLLHFRRPAPDTLQNGATS
jgi:DNA-binding transcriptional ArsR family regulator